MNATLIAILLLVVVGLSGGIGYTWSSSNAADRIASARGDTTTCTEAAEAKQAVLDRVSEQLTKLRTDHAALLDSANKALDVRDAEIASLNQQLIARGDNVRKAGKNDPQCLSLVNLPVCPAIARELWPDAAQAGAEPAHRD
jgi:predicted negative regulator of RcsB-dependent stress response